MIFLFISVFIVAALLEIPSLVRKKYWRELTVFSLFLLFALVLGLLQTIGVKLPSPMKGLEYLIMDVLHLDYKT